MCACGPNFTKEGQRVGWLRAASPNTEQPSWIRSDGLQRLRVYGLSETVYAGLLANLIFRVLNGSDGSLVQPAVCSYPLQRRSSRRRSCMACFPE